MALDAGRREARGEPGSAVGLRHEMLLYSDEGEFLARTLPFIRDAAGRGEPVLVTVGEEKIRLLRSELDGGGDVSFADIAQLGRNPARIIPAWRDFIGPHAARGRRVRGVVEPAWPRRSAGELDECARHELLLNRALADQPASVLCAYDVTALDPDFVAAARRSHPLICEQGVERANPAFDPGAADRVLDGALPDPAAEPDETEFDRDRLNDARRFAWTHARRAGMDERRAGDLVVAVSELTSNTVRHGGGRGTLRIWLDSGAVSCEVRDRGRIENPLVGRKRPSPTALEGRGLWVANELCDLVRIRSSGSGTVVRISIRLDEPRRSGSQL